MSLADVKSYPKRHLLEGLADHPSRLHFKGSSLRPSTCKIPLMGRTFSRSSSQNGTGQVSKEKTFEGEREKEGKRDGSGEKGAGGWRDCGIGSRISRLHLSHFEQSGPAQTISTLLLSSRPCSQFVMQKFVPLPLSTLSSTLFVSFVFFFFFFCFPCRFSSDRPPRWASQTSEKPLARRPQS